MRVDIWKSMHISKGSLPWTLAACLSLAALACGGLVTNTSDNDGAAEGQGDAKADVSVTDAMGGDSGGDSSSDGTVVGDSGDADQSLTEDTWVNDASEDPFSAFPPDASPDSRAGIEESCLRKTIPYLQAPIIPPYAAAGLDLHGGPTGNGSEGWNPADAGAFHYDPNLEGPGPLTLDQVQSVLCFPDTWVTCVEDNDASGVQTCIGWTFANDPAWGGFVTYYYGTGADGGAPYDVLAIGLDAWIGGPPLPNLTYAGTLEATGADGTHVSVGVNAPIVLTPSGGSATVLDFASVAPIDGGAANASTRAMVNDLYAAMMAQFLPGAPIAADCFASGECNAEMASYNEALLFVPLHLEIDVVVEGPVWPSQLPNNNVIGVTLYADPQPQWGF